MPFAKRKYRSYLKDTTVHVPDRSLRRHLNESARGTVADSSGVAEGDDSFFWLIDLHPLKAVKFILLLLLTSYTEMNFWLPRGMGGTGSFSFLTQCEAARARCNAQGKNIPLRSQC